MALTLSVLGVPEDAIVDDYAMSDAAYKELADRDAMVGALAQVSLEIFVCRRCYVEGAVLPITRLMSDYRCCCSTLRR